MNRRPRRNRLVSAAAAAGTLAAVVLGAAAVPAQAQVPPEFNPFVAAGGYSIYARGDATLDNSETEGAIAVAGELGVRDDGGNYAVLHFVAGTPDYTLPTVDGDATRLLFDTYATDSGRVEITNANGAGADVVGALKIATQDDAWSFFERGGFIRYRLAAGDVDAPPLVDASDEPWPGSAEAAGAEVYTQVPSVPDYVEADMTWTYDEAAQCLADVADPSTALANHLTVTDGLLSPLAPDQVNVVDYADIAGLQVLGLSDTAVTPGPTNPVVIRVEPGTTSIVAPRPTFEGFANYLMWDLSALSGPVTMTAADVRIDGSVYAPDVDLTIDADPFNGQVVANDLALTNRAGEAHAWFFRGTIPCLVAATGGFELLKSVTGDAAGDVPADTTFTVGYALDGVAQDPLTVGIGEPLDVADLPAGTEVTLGEVMFPDVPGVTWGEPVWTVDGVPAEPDENGQVTFVVGADAVVAVGLTNVANPVAATAGFTVSKVVTGDAADAVPPDTAFPVGFWLDGVAQDPLLVTAGEPVQVEGLTPGSVVQLAEPELPALDGVTWGSPTWTIDGDPVTPDADGRVTFTVAEGGDVAIGLTNVASVSPTPTPSPSTPAPSPTDPGAPELPGTGSDAAGLAVLVGALLLAGTGILVARRRSLG